MKPEMKAGVAGFGARFARKIERPSKHSPARNHRIPSPARRFAEVKNEDGHFVGIEAWISIGDAALAALQTIGRSE